ncbi:AAA-like domain protein [Mycobacterium xenopi 3993]|nr:AAA-like domain protein [Mycobacterium xenopi 3993]
MPATKSRACRNWSPTPPTWPPPRSSQRPHRRRRPDRHRQSRLTAAVLVTAHLRSRPVLQRPATASARCPLIVLRTNKLALPGENEDAADDPTKLFGDVIYNLFATIARQVLFTEPGQPSRFGLFNLDEARHLTRSPIGNAIIEDFVVDGRKHDCAIGLASQDPAHFGRFTGLIPTLFLFRQVDEGWPPRSFGWPTKTPPEIATWSNS